MKFKAIKHPILAIVLSTVFIVFLINDSQDFTQPIGIKPFAALLLFGTYKYYSLTNKSK